MLVGNLKVCIFLTSRGTNAAAALPGTRSLGEFDTEVHRSQISDPVDEGRRLLGIQSHGRLSATATILAQVIFLPTKSVSVLSRPGSGQELLLIPPHVCHLVVLVYQVISAAIATAGLEYDASVIIDIQSPERSWGRARVPGIVIQVGDALGRRRRSFGTES